MTSHHSKAYAVGVGCRAECDGDALVALIGRALGEGGIAARGIAVLATIDARRDHPAVLHAASHFGLGVVSFHAARLELETPRLLNPCEAVFARVGCHGVAESAALAAAGVGAMLVVGKTVSPRATVAIARSSP